MANPVASAPRVPIRWQVSPARLFVDDDGLRREWDGLNGRAGQIPVLSSEMVACALTTLASGSERLFVGHRDETVVVMAVMTPISAVHWATFQPSQMPLGALVVAAGESLSDLGAALMHSSLLTALVVSFTQMDPLVIDREPDAPNARNDDYIRTAWIDVVGEFDAYWAERGKNLRQNLRKQRNRLAADGTSAVTHTWRSPDEMASALARYGALESSGWKAAQGTAIDVDNSQGKFYRALFEAAARRGEAVIYEYLLDSRTVAMNLCIHRGGTLVILKTTYDEGVKPLSPAFLLQEDQLQSIFGSREFRRIEYYGRVMEWHTRWTNSSRGLFHTTVYRWPLLGKLAAWRRRRIKAQAAAEPSPVGEPATS